MRKYLIGTILVLAALAACNKEIETSAPVVDNGQEETTPGKITLTFTATIDEGTRTSYDENLQGSWLPNEAISVCVTDRKNNYQTAVFTTEDGETFSGQVPERYTTIVSGVYPANDKHVFDLNNGKVTSVYLSDTYSLGTANDGGTALPMVGEMEKGVFTFHHICGALKIEVVDIFNTLTFTTASENITGVFNLDNKGRLAMPATNGGGKSVTFNYDRLSTNPALDERLNRTFYIPVPDGTLTPGAKMAIKNANNVSVFEKTASNNNGITFNSNVIKRFPVLGLNQRNDWTITPDLTGEHPEIHFDLQDQNEKYLRVSTTLDNFNSSYGGSVIKFIEDRINSTNNTQTGTTTYVFSNADHVKYYDDGPNKVYIMVGVDSDDKNNRKFNLDYQLYSFTVPDPATQDYLYWLGDWAVHDDVSTTPKLDLWTITRSSTNSSYTVRGVFNGTYETTTIKCEALFQNGGMKFLSQKVRETSTMDYFLLGSTGQAADRIEGVGNDIMTATKDDANNAHLDPIAPVKRYYLIALRKTDGSFYSQYGYRFLTSPAAMTRVPEQ